MQHKPYSAKSTGEAGTKPVSVPKKKQGNKTVPPEELQPYFPDPELVRAVNVALLLERPLLVMGEPGCGKSLLAKDIAFRWYGNQMYTKDKYFLWPVKSTSKAKEGLYEFDYLGRLRDANAKIKKASNPANYVRYGELAKAMKASTKNEKAVLLIDEIDKADIDFSNDLLNELEQNSFSIPETSTSEVHEFKPFIIITSNSEKDLSDAFLRRCVFHYIDLFSNEKIATDGPQEWLKRIITARYYNGQEKTDPMIDRAIDTFVSLRKRMNADMLTFRKTISTSEFLDWFSVLKTCSDDTKLANEMKLGKELNEWINNKNNVIPFGNALFKTTKSLMDLQKTKP